MKRNPSVFIDLIEAICTRMEEDRLPFPSSCVVPSEFFVTLLPEVFDEMQQVRKTFEEELYKALDARLAKMNNKKPHKKNGAWTLQLFSADPAMQARPVEIDCAIPREADSVPPLDGSPDPRTIPVARPVARTGNRCWLEYMDKRGARSYEFRPDRKQMSIGRDPTADLVLDTATDVSRFHCIIRRDPGEIYWIWDVSSLGTTVNGVRLVRYVPPPPGQQAPPPSGVRLLDHSKIVLAQNVVTLEFRIE